MPSTHAVERLLTALQDLPTLGPEPVAACLAAADLPDPELDALTRFAPDHYARVRLHRDRAFEVLLLGWEPGQATPIHDHAGQHGWVRVLRGAIEEVSYRPLSPLDFDHDDLGGGERRAASLAVDCCAQIAAGPAVARVDRQRAIHRLRNPSAAARAVTLHVYAAPHDACLAFDLEAGVAWRREAGVDAVHDR